MDVEQTEIPEVLLIKPAVYGDERGYFKETFHQQRYADLGIEGNFVQDNVSFSSRGVLLDWLYEAIKSSRVWRKQTNKRNYTKCMDASMIINWKPDIFYAMNLFEKLAKTYLTVVKIR